MMLTGIEALKIHQKKLTGSLGVPALVVGADG